MRKIIIVMTLLSILTFTVKGLIFAQSTTLLTYDANGNRVKKQIVGTSPHPMVTVSPEAVNANQPSTLVASGCTGTVQWSPTNQTGSQITVAPTATTEYTAQCVVNGCPTNGFAKATVTVMQCVVSQMTVAASVPIVRYGQSVSLYAFGCNDGTVLWSTGQKGSPINTVVYGPVTQFTATCMKPYCENAGSAFVYVGGTTGCGTGDVLITVKSGNWNDPSVWSCGRIPTQNDEVYLGEGHSVNVNVTGYAKLLIHGGGRLLYPSSDPVYSIIFPAN